MLWMIWTLRAGMRAKTIALFDLLEVRRCRHQALAAYFDEQIADCGTSCDRCRGTTTRAGAARVDDVRAPQSSLPPTFWTRSSSTGFGSCASR
jgi:superfamily II DNA helicase RecQ